MGDTFIVHGVPPSPYTRKVMVVLKEKGIAYERRDLIPLDKTPELLAKNPLGLIPILEHEGRYIPDSSVICAYIEKLYPQRPMYPDAPAPYADALFLEEYADTRVMQSLSPVFFERFVKVHVLNGTSDESRVEQALAEDIPPVFDYLEGRLTPGASSLLSEFAVADASLGNMLACLDLAGESIDARRWPKLAGYHDALLARASFQAVMPAH